jgi:hypothetical protein
MYIHVSRKTLLNKESLIDRFGQSIKFVNALIANYFQLYIIQKSAIFNIIFKKFNA